MRRFLSLFSPATVAVLIGAALFDYGLWLAFQPLAFLVPGLLLIGASTWLLGPVGRSYQ